MAAIQESEERKKKALEEVKEVNVSNNIDTSVETSEPEPVSNEGTNSGENVNMNVEDTIVHDGETVGTNETEKTF